MGKGFGYALTPTIEKQNEKDQERRAQQLLQKKRSRGEDVQDLSVLKRTKSCIFDEQRAARLKQQEIIIPQWPELAMNLIDFVIGIYPSRTSLALTFSILVIINSFFFSTWYVIFNFSSKASRCASMLWGQP